MILNVLRTGSKGNCYLLESESGEFLVIDAGAHKAEVMKATNYDTSRIAAVMITHEHGDHAAHIKEWELSGRPLIVSEGTAEALQPRGWVVKAKPGQLLKIGTFQTLPFNVIHDAAEPFGYLIRNGKDKIVFATDTAALPIQTKGVTAFIVECNWDGETLSNSEDPPSMKERITQTHMGLAVLKDFLKGQDLSDCKKIVLIHASRRNLNEEKAVREIQELTGIQTYLAKDGFKTNF